MKDDSSWSFLLREFDYDDRRVWCSVGFHLGSITLCDIRKQSGQNTVRLYADDISLVLKERTKDKLIEKTKTVL